MRNKKTNRHGWEYLALVAQLALWTGIAAAERTSKVPLAAEQNSAESETRSKQLFTQQVRPVLESVCLNCHSSHEKKSGLDLSSRSGALKGGNRGPAVIPGSAESSLLYKAVRHEGDLRMPYLGDKLSDDTIASIADWIETGALYEAALEAKAATAGQSASSSDHWAFQLPKRPPVPAVKNQKWVRNPIDAFVAAAHEQRGLIPRPPAGKEVLLRRVYLDLIGLPPTPKEIDDFLADRSENAYEKVVDKLLASPQYGERWGRHWMDVWRYSDWYGFRGDIRNSQPHIWRWRDWIIESLNADKGYDRMIAEMLAGDEIAPTDPDILRATGYLVRSWYKFNKNEWLRATVDHTATAFLGTSLRCARCHAHMYDPIPQEEYYQFRAFFEPHAIRIDRLPGQPDTTKDGIPRVYDAHHDALTFLFVRGDEAQPDQKHSLSPAIPQVFGKPKLDIASVVLPLEAYYPDIRPFVQDDVLKQAKEQVQKAETELSQARETLAAVKDGNFKTTSENNGSPSSSAVAAGQEPKKSDEGKKEPPTPEQAQAEVELAEKVLSCAQANLTSLEARVAADRAKFRAPDGPDVEDLAKKARQAERWSDLCQAEEKLVRAQRELAEARKLFQSDKEAADKAFTSAEKKFAQALQQLTIAQEALKSEPVYTPVGEVYPRTSTGRRLALARWIADRQNPLTARVAINHMWLRHFGEALVPTVAEFGRNGQPPSHPELLDWLSVEFMEKNWSMKAIHRLVVTSNTYGMDSSAGEESKSNQAIDRDNKYLWRMNRGRMEAELVRDTILHVAGQLDTTIGGPEIDEKEDQVNRRRSLYFRHAFDEQVEFLKLFDAANPVECYRRAESVTPQQGLAMINSKLSLSMARALAQDLSQKIEDNEEFITDVFRRTLGRLPSAKEISSCKNFLKRQANLLRNPAELTLLATDAAEQGKAGGVSISDPEIRARAGLVHVLFSHSEFVTIR